MLRSENALNQAFKASMTDGDQIVLQAEHNNIWYADGLTDFQPLNEDGYSYSCLWDTQLGQRVSVETEATQEIEMVQIADIEDIIRMVESNSFEKTYSYVAVSDTNNNWCNMEYKKIFKLANVQLSTDNQALLMNDLYSLGLIKYSKNISKLNVSVNFIDNDSDVALTVTQLRDLGKEYLMFCGEDYIRCEKCGVPIKKSRNGRIKYCNECGVFINREKTKDRMKTLRNK